MSQAVPVSIELSPRKIPTKFKVFALVFAMSVVSLQFIFPAWKIVSETGNAADTLERPYTESPLARGLLFNTPSVENLAPPPPTMNRGAVATNGQAHLSAKVDWKATMQVLLLSLAYLAVGTFGVFAGKPDRSLLVKRIRQFLVLSCCITAAVAAMSVYSCLNGKFSPGAYWHKAN